MRKNGAGIDSGDVKNSVLPRWRSAAINSIVDPCNEATSFADHHVITGKGNLKWEGSFEALKAFLNVNQISTATKWTLQAVELNCVKPVNWPYGGTQTLVH